MENDFLSAEEFFYTILDELESRKLLDSGMLSFRVNLAG